MQALRDFWRFHFLKVLLVLVALQLGVVAWLQVRNHRPEAVADDVYVVEGHSIKFQPLRNDIDKDEEDMDSLRILHFSPTNKGEIVEDGKYLVYKSEYGFVGVDSFLYVISDGKKESKEGWVKIVIDKNKEPIVKNDYLQSYVNSSIKLNVLVNDVDEEGDSIFIESFSQPTKGALKQIGTKFLYTPNSNLALVDSFYYTLSDGFSSSAQASVVINVKDKKDRCYPWLNADVGDVEQGGSLTCANNALIMQGSGNDIWNDADAFNYSYQIHTGDFEMSVYVEKLEDTHEWAKAGIMARYSLSSTAPNVFIYASSKHGLSFQKREDEGVYTQGFAGVDSLNVPYWVKLTRNGDKFVGSYSENGTTWKKVAECELELPDEVYLGLALTSHDNSKLSKAVFKQTKWK